jgi:hypothetical protein
VIKKKKRNVDPFKWTKECKGKVIS